MSSAADKARGARARLRRGVEAFVTEPAAPVPAPPAPPAAPDGALVTELAHRSVPLEDRLRGHGPLFTELVGLISDAEEAELLAAASDADRAWLTDSEPADRRAALIAMGVARDLLDLRARTGLSPAMPPTDVHAMTHSEWATGGDPWYADMIEAALREGGLELRDGGRVLDFGCSSGRVVRMLAARRPQVQWHGCDVNAAAIAWAREAFPAITFLEQPLRPQLDLADGALDAAFAISIWSHYAEEPAAVWLDELHRIIRPGGLALITTHGMGAVAYRSNDPNHGEAAQRPVVGELYRSGFSFVDAFAGQGDWGVVDPEWGVSFIDPEWMLRTITPKWSAVLYRPAAIDYHQDLWVLRREPAARAD